MRDKIERILVSRLRYLGDIVLSIPFIKNLRTKFPHVEISYLTKTNYAPLLQNSPVVDKVVAFDPQHAVNEQIVKLRRERFDLSIDLLGSSRSAILSRCIGANKRVGRVGLVQGLCYTHEVRGLPTSKDAVDTMLNYLKPLEIEPIKYGSDLQVHENELDWANMYLRSGGVDFERPLIGINPGGRWDNKRWPESRYVELASSLVESGWQVVFTQDCVQGALLQRIMDQVDNSIICADYLPIRRQAALLAQFDVFLGNYSGMIHLAAAVGTRVIALIGPDDPTTSFPYSSDSGHHAIYHEVPCRDRCINECPLETLDCLTGISTKTVFEAIQSRRPAAVALQ